MAGEPTGAGLALLRRCLPSVAEAVAVAETEAVAISEAVAVGPEEAVAEAGVGVDGGVSFSLGLSLGIALLTAQEDTAAQAKPVAVAEAAIAVAEAAVAVAKAVAETQTVSEAVARHDEARISFGSGVGLGSRVGVALPAVADHGVAETVAEAVAVTQAVAIAEAAVAQAVAEAVARHHEARICLGFGLRGGHGKAEQGAGNLREEEGSEMLISRSKAADKHAFSFRLESGPCFVHIHI